jgi:hypothetical protein
LNPFPSNEWKDETKVYGETINSLNEIVHEPAIHQIASMGLKAWMGCSVEIEFKEFKYGFGDCNFGCCDFLLD